MPTFHIIPPLRRYTDGQRDVDVQGETVTEALHDLVTHYSSLQSYLYTEGGELRSFVTLFLNGEQILHVQGGEIRLQYSDCLIIIPEITGGQVLVSVVDTGAASRSRSVLDYSQG